MFSNFNQNLVQQSANTNLFNCDQCQRQLPQERMFFSDRTQDLDFCSANCKASWEASDSTNNKKVVPNTRFIFSEENFKNYLRKNANRNWFIKPDSNAVWYTSRSGNHGIGDYVGKCVVGISYILTDPSITIDKIIRRFQEIDNANDIRKRAQNIALSLISSPSHEHYYYGNRQSAATIKYLSQVNTYRENVEITLGPDGSKWVASDILVNELSLVVKNLCKWSNDIWLEKFEEKPKQVQTVNEKITNLTNSLSRNLSISSASSSLNKEEITSKITLKERELERKEKIFNLYLEKRNEDGIERLEKEITNLEAEIAELKMQLDQKIAQIEMLTNN